MSANTKVLALIAAALGLFVLGSLPATPRLLSGVLIVSAIACGGAIALVRCPACGKRVCRRPTTVFGKTITVGAPPLHRTCHFCGFDLQRPGV
jgi:hypothetical protein